MTRQIERRSTSQEIQILKDDQKITHETVRESHHNTGTPFDITKSVSHRRHHPLSIDHIIMICLVYDHTARSDPRSIRLNRRKLSCILNYYYSSLLRCWIPSLSRSLSWPVPGVPFPQRKLFYDLPCARHKIGNLTADTIPHTIRLAVNIFPLKMSLLWIAYRVARLPGHKIINCPATATAFYWGLMTLNRFTATCAY